MDRSILIGQSKSPRWFLQLIGKNSKLVDNHDKPHTYYIIEEGIRGGKSDEQILIEIERCFGKGNNKKRQGLINYQRSFTNDLSDVKPKYENKQLGFDGQELQNKIIIARKALIMKSEGVDTNIITSKFQVSESWIREITPRYIMNEQKRLGRYLLSENKSINVRIPSSEKNKKLTWTFEEDEIEEVIEGIKDNLSIGKLAIRVCCSKDAIKALLKNKKFKEYCKNQENYKNHAPDAK